MSSRVRKKRGGGRKRLNTYNPHLKKHHFVPLSLEALSSAENHSKKLSSSEISNKFKRKRMTTGKSYIHFTSLFLTCPGYLKRCQMSHGCWWQEATGEERPRDEEQGRPVYKIPSSGSKIKTSFVFSKTSLSAQCRQLVQFTQKKRFLLGRKTSIQSQHSKHHSRVGPTLQSLAAITAACC